MKSRTALGFSLLLMAGSALAQQAINADVDKARKAKTVAEALLALGVRSPEPGRRVLLEAPDIAVAGDLVRLRVSSKIPGTDWMALLAERSDSPVLEVTEFPPGADHQLESKVKLGRTGKVIAVVRASGKYFQVSREVKIATLIGQLK